MDSTPKVTIAELFPLFERQKSMEAHYFHKEQNFQNFTQQCKDEGVELVFKKIRANLVKKFSRSDWTTLMKYLRVNQNDPNLFRTFAIITKKNQSNGRLTGARFSFEELLKEAFDLSLIHI